MRGVQVGHIQRCLELGRGGCDAADEGFEDFICRGLYGPFDLHAIVGVDAVEVAFVAVGMPLSAHGIAHLEPEFTVFIVHKAADQRAEFSWRHHCRQLFARYPQVAGGKQVGQKVIGKAVHGVGQFQGLVGAGLVGHHCLLQCCRMAGHVGGQGPLTEVVGVVRCQLQVAAQRHECRNSAAAAGDAVPLLGQRITQGVIGFVRLFAFLDRLVDGVDLLLHHRQDLLRFLP